MLSRILYNKQTALTHAQKTQDVMLISSQHRRIMAGVPQTAYCYAQRHHKAFSKALEAARPQYNASLRS